MANGCLGYDFFGKRCRKQEVDDSGYCADCLSEIENGPAYSNSDAYEDYKSEEIKQLSH